MPSIPATATVEDIRALIHHVCERLASQPAFTADLKRLKSTVVEGAYPVSDDAKQIRDQLTPMHTVSLAFSLGFLAGMLDDPYMGGTYEVLLRVLETLGDQRDLVYGFSAPTHGAPDDPASYPHFIVKVPSTPHQYLRFEVELNPKAGH